MTTTMQSIFQYPAAATAKETRHTGGQSIFQYRAATANETRHTGDDGQLICYMVNLVRHAQRVGFKEFDGLELRDVYDVVRSAEALYRWAGRHAAHHAVVLELRRRAFRVMVCAFNSCNCTLCCALAQTILSKYSDGLKQADVTPQDIVNRSALCIALRQETAYLKARARSSGGMVSWEKIATKELSQTAQQVADAHVEARNVKDMAEALDKIDAAMDERSHDAFCSMCVGGC
jgi:hypothetical protein